MIYVEPLRIVIEIGAGDVVICAIRYPAEPTSFGLKFYEVPPGPPNRLVPSDLRNLKRPGVVEVKFLTLEALTAFVRQIGRTSSDMFEAALATAPRPEPEGEAK